MMGTLPDISRAAAVVLCCCALAALSDAAAFEGQFFSGQGDASFLGLLDVARRQWSSTESTFQSAQMLYRGDWDAMVEGPTWDGWWTQNSYGPTLTALPFMDDFTIAATAHSYAFWFNSIGNGTRIGLDSAGDIRPGGAVLPAPDGCLCDNSLPVPPGNGGGCNYKQGDGEPGLDDWTMEESLSGVVMQAELLLISRNASGIADFMPLFLRTSEMLESRRDASTGDTTLLTGPSSNLLAPSFGGGPNGSWSWLSGVHVTYVAALDRMVELAKMARHPMLAELELRRELIHAGITQHLLTSGPESAGKQYFVRSKDPASGLLHGKIGQMDVQNNKTLHGYFEASPNHDAVYLRVVNDTVAEDIMATIDMLGEKLRPNVHILPNTDAGGGVGYDDMICGNGKTCSWLDDDYLAYGKWVNGGVWTTQEARAIMAYFRTGRWQAAQASMECMLNRWLRDWKMDAPYPNFGLNTWSSFPTMITIDAFGCSSAFVRGIFEYIYSSESLTLVPHLPPNISALEQKFGVRWGAYRLFISTNGMPGSGIQSVSLNGSVAKAPHKFNGTAVTLSYVAMPVASLAATAAMSSDVSTASDAIQLHISFNKLAPATQAVVATPPGDYALRLAADSFNGSEIKPGQRVTSWNSSSASAEGAAVVARADVGAPILVQDAAGRLAVEFSGQRMQGALLLAPATTIFAVIQDQGTQAPMSSVLGYESYRGLDITPIGCRTGTPPGLSGDCGASNATHVVSIDWYGSGDNGFQNLSGQVSVVSVTYGDASNPNVASSAVNGCPQHGPTGVAALGAGPSRNFFVGGRADHDQYGRLFFGKIYEVLVYNRSLPPAERMAATRALQQKYKIASVHCDAPPKPPPLCNAPALRSSGLSVTEMARLRAFMAKLSTPALTHSLPYQMAVTAGNYMIGFDARCAGLNNGTILPLSSKGATETSLGDLLRVARKIFMGLNNCLLNRYSLHSAEPLARQLAQLWNETAYEM